MSALWLALLVGGLLVATYGVTTWALADRSASVRLCGTGTLFCWTVVVAFHVLSIGRAYTLAGGLVLSLAAAAVVLGPPGARRHVTALARRDAAALCRGAGQLDLPSRLLLGAVALFAAVLIAPRTMVSPPLSWDDLTYHVFKAGAWVQAGGFRDLPGPDASGYYDYYPGGGEAYWSWFFLPARSGTFLVVGSLSIWLLALLAGATASRRLDASVSRSVVAGVAIVSVPAASAFTETSYVDNIGLAAFLTGFVFLLECRRSFGWGPAAFALASFAIGVGTKSSGVPLFALALAWLAVEVVRSRPRTAGTVGRGLAALLGVALVASIVAVPWYARSWVDHQSPMYPLGLSVAGLEGNEQLEDLLSGEIYDRTAPPATLANLVQGLVDAEQSLRVSASDPVWQPFPMVWVVLAAAAVVFAFTRRSRRYPTAFLVAVEVLVLYELMSPESYSLRTIWVNVLSRLLLVGFAGLVLLAAMLAGRVVHGIMIAMAAAQLAAATSGILRSWTALDRSTLVEWLERGVPALLVIAIAGAGMLLVARSRRPLRVGLLVVGAIGALGLIGTPLEETRAEARDAYYRGTDEGRSYRIHAFPRHGCAWPLWRAVDRDEDLVVAFTSGFDLGDMHNNFRAPFLGSRLQNRVVYVPVTADGAILDYADESVQVDDAAWLRRLEDEGVQYLAVLPPDPPEGATIRAHPEVFEPVAEGTCSDARLYRVDTGAIRSPPGPR